MYSIGECQFTKVQPMCKITQITAGKQQHLWAVASKKLNGNNVAWKCIHYFFLCPICHLRQVYIVSLWCILSSGQRGSLSWVLSLRGEKQFFKSYSTAGERERDRQTVTQNNTEWEKERARTACALHLPSINKGIVPTKIKSFSSVGHLHCPNLYELI